MARNSEAVSFPEKENSFMDYKKAILAYDAVYNHILKHSQGLINAKQHATDHSKKEDRRSWKFAFIGAVLGAIFGVLLTITINHWDKILSIFPKT